MKIIIAKSFTQRLIGLMFKNNVNYSLLFLNCNKIHTFFMKFNLDLLYIDLNNKIVKIKKNIKPNNIIIFPKQKGFHVLEIPSKYQHNYKCGDYLFINND